MTREDKVWSQIHMPDQLSTDCGSYKWRQNQSHVEVFVRLPVTAKPKQARRKLHCQDLPVIMPHTSRRDAASHTKCTGHGGNVHRYYRWKITWPDVLTSGACTCRCIHCNQSRRDAGAGGD